MQCNVRGIRKMIMYQSYMKGDYPHKGTYWCQLLPVETFKCRCENKYEGNHKVKTIN